MSSPIAAPPLPHANAEHGLTSGPADEERAVMALLPMRDLPLDKDGDFQVETVNLSIMSLKELKSNCVGYQLPHSGTKPALRDRLLRFSHEGMAKWKAALLPHARIAHKGMRSGGIKKPTRLQARLLAAEQRLGRQDHAQPPYSMRGNKDKRTQAEVDGLLLWADEMVAKMNAAGPSSRPLSHSHLPNNRQLPSMPIRVNEDLAQHFLVSVMTEALKKALPEHLMEEDMMTTSSQCTQEAPLNGFENSMSESVTDSSAEASPFSLPSMPIPTHADEVGHNLTSDSVADSSAEAGPSGSPLMPSQTLAPFQPERSITQPGIASTGLTGGIVGVRERVLRLANSQPLVYTEASLPENPPTRFGNHLNRLIPCWSDENPYYQKPLDPYYPIVLNGVPIPIKYWKEMYLRNGQWSLLKSPWMKWKYVMEKYEALTPTEFWKRYTNDDGGRLPLTAISDLLRKERQVENLSLVREARAALGENLNEDFQYRRGNSVKTMTRVWDIARLYKEKHNGEDKEND
ncbi:hypothetical protein IW262DRAFT_1466981 [Armillaria fumosa]|nr:hypothetical protein IW262DRAFT_1466981 [Armillaria fumosa]